MAPISQAPVSGRYLSFAEREEIAMLRAGGCGVREIGRRSGRPAFTISGELRRNAGTRGGYLEYRATTAQWHADRRGRRPKAARLAVNEPRRRYVQERLAGAVRRPDDGACAEGPDVRWADWRHGRRQDRRWATARSPEQIANRLRADFPDDDSMRGDLPGPVTSRAAGPSAASSPRACAPAGRCASPERARAVAGRVLSCGCRKPVSRGRIPYGTPSVQSGGRRRPGRS